MVLCVPGMSQNLFLILKVPRYPLGSICSLANPAITEKPVIARSTSGCFENTRHANTDLQLYSTMAKQVTVPLIHKLHYYLSQHVVL